MGKMTHRAIMIIDDGRHTVPTAPTGKLPSWEHHFILASNKDNMNHLLHIQCEICPMNQVRASFMRALGKYPIATSTCRFKDLFVDLDSPIHTAAKIGTPVGNVKRTHVIHPTVSVWFFRATMPMQGLCHV